MIVPKRENMVDGIRKYHCITLCQGDASDLFFECRLCRGKSRLKREAHKPIR